MRPAVLPAMFVAGNLAAVAAGWLWMRSAAEPGAAQVRRLSRPPTPAMGAPSPAAAGPRGVPGTPPTPLAAVPDALVRADAASLLERAADARARGDLRAVLALLRAAVERAPAVETHGALGAFYLELGAASAAETHLRTSLEGDPNDADRWIALANALALKPDPLAAAGALDRARVALPGLRITRDADGRLVRAPS